MIVIFFYIILFLILCYRHHTLNYTERFSVPTSDERPFVNVYDNNRNQLKIVLLSHPFTRDSSWEQYKKYKKDNFLILGIASYNEFPKITTNKFDVLNNPKEKAWTYNYMELLDGWLHCFRTPDKYISNSMPKALISESDFTNYSLYKPDISVKKIYDYIYVCPKDKTDDCYGWVSENKNWKLGVKCIKILSGKLKLKGLIVGRKGCPMPKNCDHLLTTTDFLSQKELINSYRQSKFVLLPNKTDASPRVLTEALCTDLPALLNYHIVGGWKYINEKNGVLFKNLDDIENGAKHILKNIESLEPRKQYLNNYGKEKSGKILKSFIENNFSNKISFNNVDYLTL